MSTPPLPPIKNREIRSIHNGVVCWTDPANTTYQTSVKDWLDAVPPYKSTYPQGNKLTDEAAEAAHLAAMSFWRAATAWGAPVPEPVSITMADRLRNIEEAASSLLIRMDDVVKYEKRAVTYAGTQAGRAAQVEVEKAKLDVALWAEELRLALAK